MRSGRIRLLPGALLSLPVFALSFAWVLLVQVAEIAHEGHGNVAVRFALLAVVQLVFFVFPLLAWRVVCPRVRPRSWTWILLLSILLGAVVRGVAFGVLLFLAGSASAPNVAVRVFASVAHMAVVTLLLWFLVSEVRTVQSRRRQLLGDRDQLLLLQQTTQRKLERLGDLATAGIRASILDSLGTTAATSTRELLERLRLTIDDVVRPLSHQLATRSPSWKPTQPRFEDMRIDWRQAARDGLQPIRLRPLIVLSALVWLALPAHVLLRYGPLFWLFAVCMTIVGIPAFVFARRLAIRASRGHGSGASAVWLLLAATVGGLVPGLATLSYMRGEPAPFLFVAMLPLGAVLISAPLAVAEAARSQSLEMEAQLEATTADLRWAIARTREQHRQQERALAHALHGRVQASLAAAIVRLDRAMARGDDDESLREALHAEVVTALAELDFQSTEPDALDDVMALTQRNWTGAVAVSFASEVETRTALAGDPLCAQAVNDLIPELVFNSYQHGGADEINVELDAVDPKTLRLTVTDNGTPTIDLAAPGLGSALLEEASISWERTRRGEHTVTTCLLPLLVSDPA